MRIGWPAVAVLLLLLGPVAATPPTGQAVPAWTLADAAGHPHALAHLRGLPHVVFFVCGCAPCHACARLWAQAQRGGELTGAMPTVVIFLGNAAGAKAFAAETGLDLSRTLLLTDPEDRAARAYGVVACPRVFVLNARTRLAYTNPDGGAGATALSATAIVSRALTAWRGLSPD